MRFLEDLWRGNTSPGDARYNAKSEYSRVYNTMEQCEEHMRKVLSSEDWKVFDEFVSAEIEASCLSSYDCFVDGFRMGAKLMLDILEGRA